MKRLIPFLFFLSCCHILQAAGFPKVSTGEQEFWYYLKFTQGTFVVASNGDDAVCKALIPTERGSQLWKVEGSAIAGYTFTNKLGLRLYVTGTSQGSEVRAKSSPTSMYRFKINASGSNYTISPYSNTGQSFNVWGGMGFRNDIKLYSSSDANAPVAFLTVEEVTLRNTAINVVPYPVSVVRNEGILNLRELVSITCFSDSTALLARRLADDLRRTAGLTVNVDTSGSGAEAGPKLSLVPDDSFAGEAYNLTVTSAGIVVRASAFGGFFNALQTLRQLMPVAIFGQEAMPDADWQVPCLVIDDAPLMQHRGFHLDISRHFFDKAEVKKLLDMASVYKLNRFHWHLTDDQGWRVEIPEYPRLTTVGAIRNASLSVCDQSGNRFFDDTEYGRGCFYTLDDLREVVAYARERNIEIIPEIDLPGHMTACIVAYPELGCNPEKKIEVMTEGGISRDILNVGRPATMNFLKCVLGHLAEVFPYELMHIGGDECPTSAWQSNADCLRLIANEGLTDVNDIQPWLVEQLGNFLREGYGKQVVVWDELLARWNNAYTTKPVVMSWRGIDYAAQAADRGFSSIMVPTNPLYFDYMQLDRDELEIDCPYNSPYSTINTLERVYNFNPLATVSGREHFVLGTQANLWTESCTSNREAEYQYYPRLLALSEIAWMPAANKDFSGFYRRLQHQAGVLHAKDITYAPHYFDPEELTPVQAAAKEAADILRQSTPGAVGYPDTAEAEALQQALILLQSKPDDAAALAALQQQLDAYKSAPIVLPQADRLYKIVSASTYFRERFNGSSLYTTGSSLAIHYTQQCQPEEVWQFVPQADGSYQVVSLLTGNALDIPTTDNAIVHADNPQGSAIRVSKATRPTANYTYIPGVVNLHVDNHNLFVKLSGRDYNIVASQNSALCHPGTWRIEEITDYRTWVGQLVSAAERILAEALPGEEGQPSVEMLQYLEEEVVAPGHDLLAQDEVSRADYLGLAERYARYCEMKTLVVNQIDPSRYYLIRNVRNASYYATANTAGNVVVPRALSEDDAFRWHFARYADGTVAIFNKKTGSAACVDADADGQRIRLGDPIPWTLRQQTTESGVSGIAILDPSGTLSWHINTRSWTYALLKPCEQDASVWELIRTDEDIPTGIEDVWASENPEPAPHASHLGTRNPESIYDLGGRLVLSPPAEGTPRNLESVPLKKGIYIKDGRKVVIK